MQTEPQRVEERALPLAELVRQARALEDDGEGITQKEKELSDAFLQTGREGTLSLLEMAREAHVPHLQDFALYTLWRREDLETNDFLVLGPVEHPVAQALSEKLMRRVVAQQSLEHELGLRAVKHLVFDPTEAQIQAAYDEVLAQFSCKAGHCHPQRFHSLSRSLWLLGPRSRPLLTLIGDIATDGSRSADARRGALEVIEGLGPKASELLPALEQLRHDADIGEAVDRTLMALGGPVGARLLVDTLEAASTDADRLWPLWELARLGPLGASAVHDVLPLADSQDSEQSLSAIRALAAMESPTARQALEKALDDRDDWMRVMAAAEGLGQLRDARSRAALHRVAQTHWFAPVRQEAERALLLLEGHAVDFVPRVGEGEVLINLPQVKRALPCTTTEPAWASTSTVGPMEMSVPGGVLRGTNHGEWGGELAFVSSQSGERYIVFKGNVVGIFRLASEVVVVTGLSHLSLRQGEVRWLQQDDGGRWSVASFHRIPTQPIRMGVMKGSALGLLTEAGEVVYEPGKRLRMARCVEES